MNSVAMLPLLLLGGPAPEVESPRVRTIWVAAYNRINQQSDVWFERGDYPKIIQSLRFQASLYPNDYETASNLGWMLENIQQPEAGRAAYRRYVKNNPKDPDGALMEAQSLFIKREFAKALTVAEPALTDKAHPNLFRIVANAHSRMKNYDKSIKVWERYLKLYPKDLSALQNLKRAQERKKAAG
jgi:tetratricopeptide (TPR) repeat protein